MMPKNSRDTRGLHVWVMGNSHPDADRSFGWDDTFPNLSDPDVLIVDLTTLTNDVLESLNKQKLDDTKDTLANKFIHGGIIIIITMPYIRASQGIHAYSNYHVLPVKLSTENVTPGNRIMPDTNHHFKTYLKAIKSFSFQIEGYSPQIRFGEGYHPHLNPVWGQGVKDNAGHMLGVTLTMDRVELGRDMRSTPCLGSLAFLPPPTEPMDDALGRIMAVYGKVCLRGETPPSWVEHIQLRPANDLEFKILKLEKETTETQKKINKLAGDKDVILSHRRLLYTRGHELEDAVVRAFETLGFVDIEPMGGADKEDAAFGMGGNTCYVRGVIEAKGADRGIQMQHILQCKKWATQRAVADGGASKGIFVPNQHRLQPYPESWDARVKVEPNQLEQAALNDICIIPACALFEAVKQVLEGKEADRAKTAAKIAASKGVLKYVF